MKSEINIIEVKNLQRDFKIERGLINKSKETVNAVKGISFTVKKGEVFGFLGPNGAGKTTTIKILTTLLLPTSGECKVLGFDVASQEKDIRSKINFVFGGERNLYWRLSARDNLKYFSDLHGIPSETQKAMIPDLLELVGLTNRADDKVETYSKGMKQKLQIAKGLVNNPEIIFMDEPTIGLDPVSAREFRILIKRLSNEGKTIFLTTHYMHEADELCDRIGIIKKGNLIALDTPENLKAKNNDKTIMEIKIRHEGREVVNKLKRSTKHSILKIDDNDSNICIKIQSDKTSGIINDILDTINNEHVLELSSKSLTLEDIYIQLVGENIS